MTTINERLDRVARNDFTWEQRLSTVEVAGWVDRCVEHLEDPNTYDYGGVTCLNIRNLIFNALGGPHIDSNQVRYAVSRHPRLISEKPTGSYARMTRYRVKP